MGKSMLFIFKFIKYLITIRQTEKKSYSYQHMKGVFENMLKF
jgi:hypothetical protein